MRKVRDQLGVVVGHVLCVAGLIDDLAFHRFGLREGRRGERDEERSDHHTSKYLAHQQLLGKHPENGCSCYYACHRALDCPYTSLYEELAASRWRAGDRRDVVRPDGTDGAPESGADRRPDSLAEARGLPRALARRRTPRLHRA